MFRSKTALILFIICFLSRLCFKYLSGYDNFELFGDSLRYDLLSNRIMSGNYDLDIVAFISAPFYPYFLAICKLILPSDWENLAVFLQFLLVSLSAVSLYNVSKLIFDDSRVSLLAALIYIFYPLTMWYNFTLTQETLFQCFFIFFFHAFIKFEILKSQSSLIAAGFFFSLALLTKSHITILLPIVLLILYYYRGVKPLLQFGSIILIMVLPFAWVNYKIHNVVSLSSYGANSLLLAGHSDETYPCLTNKIYQYPEIQKHGCNLDIIFHPPYEFEGYGQVNNLAIKERNSKRLELALEWIRTNPGKYLELKINGLLRFLLPGLDFRIYPPKFWITSLILGLLIYIPAYFELIQRARKKLRLDIVLTFAVILTIAIIFLVFYPQNRFRVITLEPLLIIYAAHYYIKKGRQFKLPSF